MSESVGILGPRGLLLVQLGFEGAWRTVRGSSAESVSTSYSVVLGGLAGSIAYPVWYGLLHPLPGAGD